MLYKVLKSTLKVSKFPSFVFYCIALLIVLSLTACFVNRPSVFVLKNPNNSSEILWMNGKELIKLANDNVDLIVNYDSSRFGTLIFDVLIQNNSDEILVLSPDVFYCTYTNRLNENLTGYALDPETLIRNYDKQIDKSLKQKRSNELNNSLFLLFDIAESFQNKTEEERKEYNIKSDEREQQYYNELNRIESSLLVLANKRQQLATESLRKTSLFPGQQLSGKIHISAYLDKKVKDFTLFFPIKNDTLKVIYEVDSV